MRISKTTSLTKGLFVVLASLVLALGLVAPIVRAESGDSGHRSGENRESRSSSDRDNSGAVTEASEVADDSGTAETITAE